jgi:hypothetical protein
MPVTKPPRYAQRLALSGLLLGLVGCAPDQPAKSPDPDSAANPETPAGEDGKSEAPPPAKSEKQLNDGSGSSSPLPGSKNEAPPTRRDPEEWSQVNLLCGPPDRRDAATLWP